MQCTFAITAAKNASTGSIVPTTRVNFQLLAKAIIKPEINVVKYCKKIPAFSPIPACIFSISLYQRKNINHGLKVVMCDTYRYIEISKFSFNIVIQYWLLGVLIH